MDYFLMIFVGYFIGFKVCVLKNLSIDKKISRKVENEYIKYVLDKKGESND